MPCAVTSEPYVCLCKGYLRFLLLVCKGTCRTNRRDRDSRPHTRAAARRLDNKGAGGLACQQRHSAGHGTGENARHGERSEGLQLVQSHVVKFNIYNGENI